MKSIWTIVLLVIFACTAVAQTQAELDRAKRSDEIVKKIRQIDLLNQILPVLFTKEQIRQFLPVVEKARQRVRDIEKAEFDDLVKLEPKLDAAIKAGTGQSKLPDKALMDEMYKMLRNFSIRRQLIVGENTDLMSEALGKIWDSGQRRAAANALNIKALDPGAKVDELTEKQRLDYFIREILLDPMVYDLLVKLSQRT